MGHFWDANTQTWDVIQQRINRKANKMENFSPDETICFSNIYNNETYNF